MVPLSMRLELSQIRYLNKVMMIMFHALTVEENMPLVRDYKFDSLETAERHIPKCKNIINKPKPPP